MHPSRIALVLLAAGRSTRFGSQKLLHPLEGTLLGTRAAAMLAEMGFARRVAVFRADTGEFPDALRALGFEIVVNGDAMSGMGDSLAIGATAVAKGENTDAILVCLADMPFVTRDHVEALIDKIDRSPSGIVASALDGTQGPPALFQRRHFAALVTAHGDEGARDLLSLTSLVHGDRTLRDIDHPEDLLL